ncbi:MAG TPA: hypothetical protein DCG12_01610 [Planctomycetaceae bacterium]|nr:hypothetical protein [Planctomycetaceae bacterium]
MWSLPLSNDDLQTFQHLVMSFDTPAYMRRARDMESEWNAVVSMCRRQQQTWQEVIRIKVAQFFVRVNIATASEYFASESLEALICLHEEWQTELKSRTCGPVNSRRLAVDIRNSFERFNNRWRVWLPEVDLSQVNARRQAYNDFYVLEKECAVRSAQVARAGFEQAPMATADDLWGLFPELPALRLSNE